MLARCLSCYQPFEGNTTLERFPVGRRVAYDPARGRLWVVCGRCRRWTLAPIEERWEALEELEREVRDRGRVRARTENISLVRVGDVEIVRVGEAAQLREESGWRYTREFAARRRRAELVESVANVLDDVTTLLVMAGSTWATGAPMDPEPDPDKWLRWLRRRRFGRRAWAGQARCAGCGEELPPLSFEERGGLMLEPGGASGPVVRRLCPRCGAGPQSGALLEGVAAQHTLRRVLAYENYAGARWPTVSDAMGLVDEAGSPSALFERLSARRLVLDRIPLRVSLALEIALSDAHEGELLQLEVKALELRWREEEMLAAIVDGELTPLPGGAPKRSGRWRR